ncbi:MAG: Nudix family hydrolase [Gammaproteobacteria bacterium]|nr:Nudix family hydrolase [Gammaproteobacteria bacterium]
MSLPAARSSEPIEVVAGILRDDRGRVLLAQRPAGKHLAGQWEFPGGKREPGEAGPAALARELAEELAIRVRESRPWLALTHRYPEITVRLQLYVVEAWEGRPLGMEGQPLEWFPVPDMHRLPMPAADRPIVRAFGLDARCALGPDPAEAGGVAGLLDWARARLAGGARLLRLRTQSMDAHELRRLSRGLGDPVAEAGGKWLLDDTAERAAEAGADGVHMDGAELDAVSIRPLPDDFLVAAACRDEQQLERAGALKLDFVTLPAARSGSAAIDWKGFERLCRCSPLPVYAQGDAAGVELERVRACGGFGVAGPNGSGSSA